MSEQLFKVLRKGGRSVYANSVYDLPVKNDDGSWTPGAWMPPVPHLVECVSGYHVCTANQLVRWLNDEIYLAEVRGERLDLADKIVVSEVRLVSKVEAWNEKTARLWMADVAEHVLPIYERWAPGDDRVRKCIDAVRDYADSL